MHFSCEPRTDHPPCASLIISSDPTLYTLSETQMASLDGWKRPEDALPPPTKHTSDSTPPPVTMHINAAVDIVQDAATDCSVVASMCTALARAQRGHARVGHLQVERTAHPEHLCSCFRVYSTRQMSLQKSLFVRPMASISVGSTLTAPFDVSRLMIGSPCPRRIASSTALTATTPACFGRPWSKSCISRLEAAMISLAAILAPTFGSCSDGYRSKCFCIGVLPSFRIDAPTNA